MRFTRGMSIKDALEGHPEARQVFMRHGMGCIDCIAVTMDSIEAGAQMHGVDPDVLVQDLNALRGGTDAETEDLRQG